MVDDLVYPHERTLGTVTLLLGLLVWLALVVGTFGIALLVLAIGFLLYLFAQSALIAHIKGNGVELSAKQFPDLYAQFRQCCERLKIEKPPQAYILNGNGGLNAFATKFLGTQYVVLMSDVVDAMDKHVDGVRFYIGHELGHLRMKHLSGHFFRWPVLWLPLLGAAYSRARESTCDRHGLACSTTGEGAARALAALSSGTERWQQLNVDAYRTQTERSSGFWMSFHELIAGYPWITKRAARVLNLKASLPRRNPFAYLLALFVPFAGRLGAGFGMLILIYIVGVGAAIAIPAYQDYTTRAELAPLVSATEDARAALAEYYEANEAIPESLEALGIETVLSDGSELLFDPSEMALTIVTDRGELIFVPMLDDSGRISWICTNGESLSAASLPASCRDGA